MAIRLHDNPAQDRTSSSPLSRQPECTQTTGITTGAQSDQEQRAWPCSRGYEAPPQMQEESSRRCLLFFIDQTARWVFVRIKANKTAVSARAFLQALKKAYLFRISILLTDNGKKFMDRLFARKASPVATTTTCAGNWL